MKPITFLVNYDIVEAGFSSRGDSNMCKENKELTSEMEVDRLSIETGYTVPSDVSVGSSTVKSYGIANENTTNNTKGSIMTHKMETDVHSIPVSELPHVILEQSKKENEDFKREFGVSKDQHLLSSTNSF